MDSAPISAGIAPLSSFPDMPRVCRLDSAPISAGIPPARLFSPSSSSITRESTSTTTPFHSPIGLSISQFSLFVQFAPPVALNSATRAALSGEAGAGSGVGSGSGAGSGVGSGAGATVAVGSGSGAGVGVGSGVGVTVGVGSAQNSRLLRSAGVAVTFRSV